MARNLTNSRQTTRVNALASLMASLCTKIRQAITDPQQLQDIPVGWKVRGSRRISAKFPDGKIRHYTAREAETLLYNLTTVASTTPKGEMKIREKGVDNDEDGAVQLESEENNSFVVGTEASAQEG